MSWCAKGGEELDVKGERQSTPGLVHDLAALTQPLGVAFLRRVPSSCLSSPVSMPSGGVAVLLRGAKEGA